MKPYQETYIENLKRIAQLADLSGEALQDAEGFLRERQKKREEIRRLQETNTQLLRKFLMPVLDDIISADEAEVEDLAEFAQCLAPGVKQLDLVLNHDIHNALIVYARKWKRRDMLIRELYLCAMALYYMQNFMSRAGKRVYSWKISMMFGEAASYLKYYDEIEEPEIRGYIHRSMANLTLGDGWEDEETGKRKVQAIRRSLQVLTDPVYQKKTPSLPWDVFIYKSHQGRMTAIDYMRRGYGDQELVREMMESAGYVREKQLQDSIRKGKEPDVRWTLEYEAVLYHCGIKTLPELLLELEKSYMARKVGDYSVDGIWQNIYLPGLYAAYLAYEEKYLLKKKEVLCHMYRMVVRYVRNAPNNQLNTNLLHTLIAILSSFHEYPDGISQKDFLLNLIACRNPDIYAGLYMTGKVSAILMEEALRQIPGIFVGSLSCKTGEQVRKKGQEFVQYAYESGMLHDIGTLLFADMMALAGRSWLKEERKMYAYHVYAGHRILDHCESTRPYAMTALGHHRHYDQKGGYPKEYLRENNPDQEVTDLVSIAGYIVSQYCGGWGMGSAPCSVGHLIALVEKEAGTRWNPALTGLLTAARQQLEEFLLDGQKKAYEKAFSLLKTNRTGGDMSLATEILLPR